jgi:FAD/FMN-containing dehydrogenase
MPISPPTNLFPPGQLLTDPVELIAYESDAGFERATPDAVFLPESAADVSRLASWAAANGTPLIARGAGTGLAGAVAAHGGIVVALSRMNHILELDAHGRTALVEAGAVNLDVDAAVKKVGLYYPPDPSSGRSAAIGGNLGTNAGGPHCFKYGVTTNYIMGVEAVLANGSIVQLGGPVVDAPEYDLRGLVVGSEGTLAIVTKATLRLIANPPGVKTMMVSFDSVEQAVCTLHRIPKDRSDVDVPAGTQEPHCINRMGEPNAEHLIPVEERYYDNYIWRLDPYEIPKAHQAVPKLVHTAEDWLLAYWVGRYHGFIEEED